MEAPAETREGRQGDIRTSRLDPLENGGRHRRTLCGFFLGPAALLAKRANAGRKASQEVAVLCAPVLLLPLRPAPMHAGQKRTS